MQSWGIALVLYVHVLQHWFTCTVALGIHDMAMNTIVRHWNLFPNVARKATVNRTTRPTTMMSSPWPVGEKINKNICRNTLMQLSSLCFQCYGVWQKRSGITRVVAKTTCNHDALHISYEFTTAHFLWRVSNMQQPCDTHVPTIVLNPNDIFNLAYTQ